jgi:putative transposase
VAISAASDTRLLLPPVTVTTGVRPRRPHLNTHVSRAMAELAAARSWLTPCRLPPCASDLNPAEAVWPDLKTSLANLTKQNTGQPTALVKTRHRKMQCRAGLLDGFLAKTGLDLSNPRN